MSSRKKEDVKKTESRAYFVAHLTDGTTKDFGKRCTGVDYSQGIMVTFLHTVDENNSIVLSIIPINQIHEIEKVDE